MRRYLDFAAIDRLAECPTAEVVGLCVLIPAPLFGGPGWICFWIAARIAPLGYNEGNDRETDR
jgi:hypothetical protein